MLNWDDYHTDEAIQPRSTAAKPAPEIVEQAIEAAAQEQPLQQATPLAAEALALNVEKAAEALATWM